MAKGWKPPVASSQPRGATNRRKPDQPERREQEAVKRLLTALRAKFWVAGTVRRKGDHPGTMQTPGLADLPLVFLPRVGRNRHPNYDWQLVVIEVKSPAAHRLKHGGLSVEQQALKASCVDAGVAYIHGDLDAIIKWLLDAGYLSPGQVPHYRLP